MKGLGEQSHHVGGSVDASTGGSGLQGLDLTGVEPAKGPPCISMPANVYACQRMCMLQSSRLEEVAKRSAAKDWRVS